MAAKSGEPAVGAETMYGNRGLRYAMRPQPLRTGMPDRLEPVTLAYATAWRSVTRRHPHGSATRRSWIGTTSLQATLSAYERVC